MKGKRLRLSHLWPSPVYRRGDDGPWPRGEVRECSEAFAGYLTETFPAYFTEEAEPPPKKSAKKSAKKSTKKSTKSAKE